MQLGPHLGRRHTGCPCPESETNLNERSGDVTVDERPLGTSAGTGTHIVIDELLIKPLRRLVVSRSVSLLAIANSPVGQRRASWRTLRGFATP